MDKALMAQLEWLSDRGMGRDTGEMIRVAAMEGNQKLHQALRGMDIDNTRGRDWTREILHLDQVQTRIARAVKGMGRGWDFTR